MPKQVFVVHWSKKIPSEIFTAFECIIFHMTDLPYGRGGSPLQNLIIRGHGETKISAIRCVEEMDAGDVYLKKSLSLSGSAREIFARANGVIYDMILEIILDNPEPQPQIGPIVVFKRRRPEESEIPPNQSLQKLYDFIRMLDAPGYPLAQITSRGYKFLLQEANWTDGRLLVQAEIQITDSSFQEDGQSQPN
jgi:methionyl-tRNA formyltransferase